MLHLNLQPLSLMAVLRRLIVFKMAVQLFVVRPSTAVCDDGMSACYTAGLVIH